MGVNQPEGYVKTPEQQIPASQVEAFLAQNGIAPEAFIAYLDQQQAAQNDPNAAASGPQPAGPGQMPGGPTVNGQQGALQGGAA
jgi:hypothetical protein